MTWLKGTTTLGALAPLITQLVCGEVADGVGNTCAAGDQWVRENVGQDTIRTKAALDFTPDVFQMRAGYFSLISVPGQTKSTVQALGYNRNVLIGSASVCQIVNPYTTVPGVASTDHNRWHLLVQVQVANTTPGDYSTAKAYVYQGDEDANNQTGTTVVAVSSTGVIAIGNGCTVKITDPSGTLAVGTAWVRGFTSTYMYGIDWLPWWSRRGNGVTVPTWTIAPPGTVGTDYDIIDQVSSQIGTVFGPNNVLVNQGNFLSGVGIKTVTGLGSNALYSGTFPIALMKCRMWNHPTLGIYGLDLGPSPMDSVNGSVNRPSAGFQVNPWLQCIQTPASATSSTPVQYFMSVKADGIYVILNADPAGTGKLGTGYVGVFTPNDINDKFPIYCSIPQNFVSNNTLDSASGYGPIQYWLQKRSQNSSIAVASGTSTSTTSTTLVDTLATRTVNQDVGLTIFAGSSHAVVVSNTATTWTVSSWIGGTPGATSVYTVQRDWQTGFGRFDFMSAIGAGRYSFVEAAILNVIGTPISSAGGGGNYSMPENQPKPSTYDDKWWLWGVNYVESQSMTSTQNSDNGNFYRGYQNTRFFFIPGGGWGNGDELTDTITGEKFLLLAPDYAGAAQKVNITVNLYTGGVAVAEL